MTSDPRCGYRAATSTGRLAHVGAHLDYHPCLEELTTIHEDHADLIADLRLDRPGSRT